MDDFYISGSVGYASPSSVDFNGIQMPEAGTPGQAGAPAIVDATFDDAIALEAAVGGNLTDALSLGPLRGRVELGVSYVEADVSGGAFNDGNQIFSGDQSVLSFLLNSYTEYRPEDDARVVPYVGGGIGFAQVESDIVYFPDNGVATSPTFGVFADDTVLTTHMTGGLTIRANDAFDVFAEARYATAYGVDGERRFVAGGEDRVNASVDSDVSVFSLQTGLRYKF